VAATQQQAAADRVDGEAVAAVRAFNRLYTNVIGVLRGGYLDTPYSLTEARVLFELGQRDTSEVAELRRSLDIDAGYLSRILARLADDQLITRERSGSDARRQVIALTDAGRAVQAGLDAQAAEQIGTLLASLSEPARRRLVRGMQEMTSALTGAPRPRSWLLRPPRPGDMGWVVQAQAAGYVRQYGWDDTYEALVARIVADYIDHRDPEREAAWIAEVDGAAAGSIFCVRKSDTVAQLRLLYVAPSARGLGVGSRLVEECLRFARGAGYQEMMLWTNSVLAEARRIYQRAGFELTDEAPHRSFGQDLIGQNWSRPL
jgi:DNA-binding MarR family transcriptional regulator/GNAT superfamily N-acetyltransferase